jgi:hypothetical protein
VRAALVQALQQVEPDTVAAALHQQARAASRAAPVGPLKQLRDSWALAPESRVTLRAHLEAAIEHRTGSRIILSSRAGDLVLSEDEVAPTKMLLAAGAASAGDLGLELARRMILAGLAVMG